MPATASASGRFGVTATSNTGSKGRTSTKRAPTGASGGSSTMPSCSSESCISRSESIMPWLSTPRILPTLSVRSMPGM
jgi:hypothetical protein